MSVAKGGTPKSREHWMKNFRVVQAFYRKNGHLSMPDKTLPQWLTYQRIHAKTLNDHQLALLGSIKYKDAKFAPVCKRNEDAWGAQYEELHKFVSGHGGTKGLPMSLRSWVDRQEIKYKDQLLQPNQGQRLTTIGIDLSNRKPRVSSYCEKAQHLKKWMENYHKLEKYKEENGDCNVPFRYNADPSLGRWVSNQRKRLDQSKKDEFRVEHLDNIGFEWTRKPARSKVRGRSKLKGQTSNEIKTIKTKGSLTEST